MATTMSAVMNTPSPADARLDQIESQLWDELAAATHTRGHPWRTCTLATVSTDGLPEGRTVVLRELDRAARELVFFTDARSPKVQQIERQPQGVLVLWSAELGWQLRLSVTMSVETTGLAVSSRWAQLQMKPAAQDYLSPLPPGSTLPHAAAVPELGKRVHFAVVTAGVTMMDWLDLHPAGHRRAGFPTHGPAVWLQP